MKKWAQKQIGFTIVELLIVIVVIAILAAITIVAYNGVRDRALASALSNNASQVYKQIEAFKTLNGSYPATLAAAGVVEDPAITYDFRTVFNGACVGLTQGSLQRHVGSDTGAAADGTCGQVKAEYWNNTSFNGVPVLTRYEDRISGGWGTGSPAPGIVNNDNFTSRFTSYIVPPVTGVYTFASTMDDAERIEINNTVLFDAIANSNPCCATRTYAPMSLTAGQPVPVTVSHREGGGSAYIHLQWSYPGQALTVVPTSAFVRVP